MTAKIGSFTSTAENKKQAYLNGCKRIAKFVANDKYKNISFSVEKNSERDNSFIFTLFTNIDLSQDRSKFCKMCKEFHTSFYINEEYNCSRCNLATFLAREKQKAEISKNFYKKSMKKK